MGTYQEPTPHSQPYQGAGQVLKRELSAILGNFFFRFEHEQSSKSTMSHLIRLYGTMLLSRSKEIGGKTYTHMQQLMQACTDFANGHGKMEAVYKYLEDLQIDLRS